MNLHMLLHLVDVFRSLGPLWPLSCFPFEDANGSLKKLLCGTRYVDVQIMNYVAYNLKLFIVL